MMLAKFKQLISHKGFIRYFKNTSWMMAEQSLRIISGLFIGIWVARYLGPEKFGLFSYVVAFAAIFSSIAKLGMDGIIVRELVNNPKGRDIYLGTAFWLKFIGAFLVMGIMAAIIPFTSNDSQTNLFIFIISTGLIFQSFEVVEFYFQSQVMAKIVSICKVIQLVLSSLIKIYLVITEADLLFFVLVTAIDAFTIAVAYGLAYQFGKDNPSFYKHFKLSVAKKLLINSWPLIFSTILVSIYMRIDQVMIKEIIGIYEVGNYSAAVRLSEAIYFIPVLITTSLFPAIIKSKKQSENKYKIRMQRLYTLMVWLAICIALPMTFLSEWLISLLFGQAYQSAVSVFVVHIWASVFVFLGVASGKWYLTENLILMSFLRTLFGAMINVLLNFIFIPKIGITGAALSTLISQMSVAYLFDIFNKRTREMFLLKTQAFMMRF